MPFEFYVMAISMAAGFLACRVLWRRWNAPWQAKILICGGILYLLMPSACMGVITGGPLRNPHFFFQLSEALLSFLTLTVGVMIALHLQRPKKEDVSRGIMPPMPDSDEKSTRDA